MTNLPASNTILFAPDDPDVADGRGGYLFGFRLTSLPDVLADHSLLATDATGRLAEHWRRWVQLVSALWRAGGEVTYALYASHRPDEGRIEINFLGRWRMPDLDYRAFKPELARLATVPAEDLSLFLTFHNYPVEPMTEGQIAGLRHAVETLAGAATLRAFEVRQGEFTLPVRGRNALQRDRADIPAEFIEGSASDDPRHVYGVVPFRGPQDSFLLPYRCLSAQARPTLVCTMIQGTTLTDEERILLSGMAREAQGSAEERLAEQSVQGLALAPGQTSVDPQLRYLGELAQEQLDRLTHRPFLTATYVLSDDPRSCWQVARALAASVAVESGQDRGSFESVYPATALKVDPRLAAEACHDLNLVWVTHPAAEPLTSSERLVRLRSLADGRGAATLFRLPVAVREGIRGVPVVQVPPSFHPGPTVPPAGPGVTIGEFPNGGSYKIPVADFNKHTLVTGFTGSGKTKTILTILHQLWAEAGTPIPFLVIESAKAEYRGLIGVPAFRGTTPLRVYTVGNESCAPLRLNPFQLMPGVRVESHIGRLQTCFEAAIPPIGPSSSVIAEALIGVYRRCGWTLTDVFNKPHGGVQSPRRRLFPTLALFVDEIERVLQARAYQGDVASNVRAALVGRLKPMTMGAKGMLFECQRSNPKLNQLFDRPTVVELNDLNLEDKALVSMFLMAFLREYREITQDQGAGLRHVTVLEEAHNVLEEVQSQGTGEGAGSDVRYKAVQSFCNMITEIRSLGEGLIIADQSPHKLARDAIRNTNVQIAHQLRDADDRDAVARAMIMDDDQRDFLGKLKPGTAALFVTALEKATFVRVPPYVHESGLGTADPRSFRGYGYRETVDDATLRAHMDVADPLLPSIRRLDLPYLGCQRCGVRATCDYRETMFVSVRQDARLIRPFQIMQRQRNASPGEQLRLSARAAHVLAGGAREAAWCFLLHAFALVLHGDRSEDPARPGPFEGMRRNFDAQIDALLVSEAPAAP